MTPDDMSGCQPLMSVEDSASNHQPAMQDSSLPQSTVAMVTAMQGTMHLCKLQCHITTGLQIRRSNKDNLGIIIKISSQKHML